MLNRAVGYVSYASIRSTMLVVLYEAGITLPPPSAEVVLPPTRAEVMAVPSGREDLPI